MVETNWKCSLRTHMKICYNLGVSMQGYAMEKEITLNESFKTLLKSIFQILIKLKSSFKLLKNLLMIEQQRKGLILGI